MPKLKLGALVYAFVAICLGLSSVAVLQHWGAYGGVHGWPIPATAVVDALSALLLAVGAVTRWGIIADDGPWICRNGWLVLGGLTVAGIVVAALSGQDMPIWPTGPAVFLPHFVRRLQEKYYEGIAEAELEITAGRDGGRSPGS
ncbi:hypothetical protein ACIBL3_26855 [Kribbella sp. NPDC050124]|uniref:hypothetical protein n=1 Tax=Kribbella sp. NPDC050124 TaxID=3364114 RepID=UPI00379BF2AB